MGGAGWSSQTRSTRLSQATSSIPVPSSAVRSVSTSETACSQGSNPTLPRPSLSFSQSPGLTSGQLTGV